MRPARCRIPGGRWSCCCWWRARSISPTSSPISISGRSRRRSGRKPARMPVGDVAGAVGGAAVREHRRGVAGFAHTAQRRRATRVALRRADRRRYAGAGRRVRHRDLGALAARPAARRRRACRDGRDGVVPASAARDPCGGDGRLRAGAAVRRTSRQRRRVHRRNLRCSGSTPPDRDFSASLLVHGFPRVAG